MKTLFALAIAVATLGVIARTAVRRGKQDNALTALLPKGKQPYKKLQNQSAGVDEAVILKLAKMETPDFIRYYGYPCDTHDVITEDGYILQMHHIPHGRNGSVDDNRPVVFLQHGIFSYSGDWFTNGPGKALGFLLADNGYDVWVGNSRGNKYSRRHVKLNPDADQRFWNYSWHEMGYYDLPAMIDYVLDYTHEEKLFYIGHSQGTTSYYVMLSMRPEYNKKIIAQFSLAPVAYMTNVNFPGAPLLKTMESAVELSMNLFNMHELTNETPLFKFITRRLCRIYVIKGMCINEIFTITGFNYPQFNNSLLPIIAANFPAGSSLKQIKHYMQEIKSGDFQRFDYDLFNNEIYYGSFFPPKYDIKNIKAPIYLIYSGNDYLSSAIDVEKFYNDLTENHDKHLMLVKDKMWNHIDYMFGINAKYYVYNYVLANMKKYLTKRTKR